jgi:hypothetical protein
MSQVQAVSKTVRVSPLTCDVLVAGGGPAGVPAAISAARLGAKVILCQDRSMLGGNASSEVRMHIVGADAGGARGAPLSVEAREGGIIEEIRLATAARNPQRSAAMLDMILYELCRAEPNLTLLLDTRVINAEVAGNSITHVIADRPSTEESFRIEAKVFIDATGDSRLAVEAGANFQWGREGKGQFGETLAQDTPDKMTLGSTILFIARKHDRPMPFVAPPWARKFTEADLKFRPHAVPGVDGGLEYGYWWVEWGGHLDSIRDNPAIRDELLAIVMGVWDHCKNGGQHGAENWALDWFGFLPAKRESRRLIGQHILREQDVLQSTRFHDAIGYGGWWIDTHPPMGIDAVDEKPCEQHLVPKLFDIPLRSCLCKQLSNLMVAGRNMSATHIAFASTRVMATCAVVGQGVGTAAAYAAAHGVAPADLPADIEAMATIQQRLLRDDAYLIGQINQDRRDLAKLATFTASSFLPGSEPRLVASGQTRSVHGERGAPTDRANPGTHRWQSDPACPLPAWIELAWPDTIALAELQLTFDTGLHRVLTLSHSDAFLKKMQWGVPQSETVRDYKVQASIDGQWTDVLSISGNHQRLRRHVLPTPLRTTALRVSVLATNGEPNARICEVRVYASSNATW